MPWQTSQPVDAGDPLRPPDARHQRALWLAGPPAIDPSTLTFINVGAEDTEGDQDDERRRVPVGRPAPAPQGQQGQQGQRR